ncbi:MAG: hypothetical protein QNJ04_13865 [Desulfobacterales bacterium]|nr:hypothetical protein [Desulfobacterales bacterium]
MKSPFFCLVIVFMMVVSALPAAAGQKPRLSEEEIERRLRFIEQRLNDGRGSARRWQYGWSSFFSASTALQGYMAVKSSNADNEAKYTVGAVKSAAALALMFLRPLPAVKGAEPIGTMPLGTPERKAARLAAAEELLETNARRARERKSWKRHSAAVAVHFIGSGAIAAFGDLRDAAVSNVTGIAISQIHIWSQPHRAIDDLSDYERAFPDPPAPEEFTWELTPIRGGLGVAIHF